MLTRWTCQGSPWLLWLAADLALLPGLGPRLLPRHVHMDAQASFADL